MRMLIVSLLLSVPCFAAHAQDTAATQPGAWSPPPAAAPQPAAQPAAQAATPQWYNQQEQERPPVLGGQPSEPAQETPAEPTGSPDSDHAGVVGHLGVGFMGVQNLPVATIDGSGIGIDQVNAPSVGVRYWLSETLGLDVAVGFGLLSASQDTNSATPTITVVSENQSFGIALHAGMPLVLHHRDHYKLLLIPALDFGYTSGSQPGAAFNSSVDDLVSGLLLRLSGTIGAEIHFGFMGIPELSVQAGVGLNLTYFSVSNDICQDAGCTGTTLQNSVSGLNVGTTVNGQPWQILTGALSAIYYF